MSTEFTKGDWIYIPEHEAISADDGNIVVYETNTNQDDIRLICAAPKIFDALNSLLAMCERQEDFNDDGDGCMFDRARTALAAAGAQS